MKIPLSPLFWTASFVLVFAIAVVFKPIPSLALFDNDTPGIVRLSPTSPGVLPTGGNTVANSLPYVLTSQYPVNNITVVPSPITTSATGTTTAFTATLAVGLATQTVYICGAEIDAAATAGVVVAASITGTKGGTLNFLEGVSTLASAGNGRNIYTFNPCIPASAPNTAIVINAGAAGTAGIAAISAWGYLL
jgi:hypothetical protein